ncbi:quinohemoprotein amine dehydrogenase subunit alpha [Blastochloris tepida]|nr:quinohemoprotein amine dehydrogenase subunit alpha [Blastochloris tepida]
MKRRAAHACAALLGGGMIAGLATAATAAPDAAIAALIENKCGSCHEQRPDGTRPRLNAVRKSPEGWELTLHRMQQWHEVALTAEQQRTLVKYLSDTQGLAPTEAEPFRAVLERRPGHVEEIDDAELGTFCARCHTYARVGLQRRDADEWLKLVHTHVGQWPTLEYHAFSRDRDWWHVATTELPKRLAAKWPLNSAAWTEWQTHKPADLSGTWRVAGHRPGKGDYQGTLTVARIGDDRYSVRHHLVLQDGTVLDSEGEAVVYTGYEWRGSVKLDGQPVREVFRLSADGSRLEGRWFANDAVTGGDLVAVRSGKPQILAVQPGYLKAGQTTKLTVVGTDLKGNVDLGPGITVRKVESASADSVTVLAEATAAAGIGAHAVAVGSTRQADALVVYDKVAAVQVEPAYTVARVGGNGGPVPPVPAQFEAIGFLAGPDGKTGTADDVRIGVMPAAWSLADFDAEAAAMEDLKFGGKIDDTGLFTPGGAGPNPARIYSTNNAANLKVTAAVKDGAGTVEGTGQLIVTVQRWNDAPVR